MIAEFTVENFYSIRSTQKISFEPSSDSFMSDEYTYEVYNISNSIKKGSKLKKVIYNYKNPIFNSMKNKKIGSFIYHNN